MSEQPLTGGQHNELTQRTMQVESLRTQLAEMTQRAEELDKLTTMQDGGISGLHEQIRELRERAEKVFVPSAISQDNFLERTLAMRSVELSSACRGCSGSGVKLYGSTATWRGGIGGQAMTTDVCDICWGSGDKAHTWADLRKAASQVADLTAKLDAMTLELASYRPICLNCGREQPCMTEEEANKDGASIPCTFDPTPKELFARCKDLTAKLAAVEQERDEVRLRRQETINMAVQLECELEQLRGQLAEAQATIAKQYFSIEHLSSQHTVQANYAAQLRAVVSQQQDELFKAMQLVRELKERLPYRHELAEAQATVAALTEKQRSCEAAFNGYIHETAHALSPDDPCVATTTEQIMSLKQERDEYKDTAAWFLALVPRANIGTEKTPSLRAYIEQIEQQLASARAALEALANLGGRTSNGNQLAQQALREMGKP